VYADGKTVPRADRSVGLCRDEEPETREPGLYEYSVLCIDTLKLTGQTHLPALADSPKKGAAMKRLILGAVVLFAVSATCAYADSVSTFHITQANMFMGPNEGFGDNVGFSFTGPGVSITGIGGMACFYWCSDPISDPNIAQPSEIFLTTFLTATIGGITYDPDTLGLYIFDAFGGLSALTVGSVGEGDCSAGQPGTTCFIQFRMTAPTNGGWSFNFAPTVDQDGNPAYIFTDGEFGASAPLLTPEPATVGLMLTGLVGIAGMVKRRARFRH
jgi:hypothetical protein